MLELGIGGYTRQQVIDVLHGRSGSRGIVKFRCDLLNREEIKIGELAVESGSVRMDSLAEIKRTARFTITEQEAQDIDWLSDRIRPVFCLKMPEIRKTYKAWGKINASFTRPTPAYLSDGTQVAANQPRFEQGRFGKAIMLEEGTTNLLSNPSFESDSNGDGLADSWSVYNAIGTTCSYQRVIGKYGSYAQRMTKTDWITQTEDKYSAFIQKVTGLTAGTTYVLSVDYKLTMTSSSVDAPRSVGAAIYHRDSSNSVKNTTISWGWAPTAEWIRKTVTFTLATGADRIEIELRMSCNGTVDWDGVQLEAKPYATSFIDGTRSAEILTIPVAGVWNKGGWEQTFSFKPTSIQAVAGKTGYLWDLCIDADNYYTLKVGSDGKPYLEVKSNGTTYQTATTNAPAMSTGTWYTLSIRGNGSQMALFVNGSKVSEVSYTEPLGDLPQYMYLGSDHNGANHANGLYDDLRISSHARTDEEIAVAYQSGKPAPVDEWTTAKFDFDNRLTGEYFTIVNDSKPVQWIEWPLGIFMPSSPTRKSDGGRIVREVEAYDTSLVLKEDVFTDRYFIPAGTKYVDAIMDILNGAGIWKVNILDHPGTLARDKEFEIGTPKLTVVNELLAAINYTSIWVDEHGYFTSRPYVLPSDREAEYEYRTDDISIIYPGATEELDLFSVPNKWVRYVSNPDVGTVLRSEYTNDLSTSPTSTVRRGRVIVDIQPVDDIADQATLDAYVRRIAYQASQVYGHLEFSTAVMPHHSFYDCLYIEHKGLGVSSKYMESSWELPLQADGTMTHSCRKVIRI